MPIDDPRLVEEQQAQIASWGQVIGLPRQLRPQGSTQAVQSFQRAGQGAHGSPFGGQSMLSIVTQAASRAELLRHLTETLRALPAELSLALWHPDLPKARMHDGVTPFGSPFDDDADADEGGDVGRSAVFDIRYWVVGTTPESSGAYLDMVMRVWSDWGWTTRTSKVSPSLDKFAHSPDGYGFSVRQRINGYLSMSGTTPTFMVDPNPTDPFPARIDHPAGEL
ncbi:hypothetical protein [Streptomyces sp. CB01580]|uniref:hypothetical protein n=1 Tax=Streptomyces sp. CB01580 TaxID=1703933 RepID=UPI0011614407|nr:hypothetical protein [Streptomyces sp. CB01580]